MSLNNEKTTEAIRIQVKSLGNIVDNTADPFHIIYRVCYKLTKINYNFKTLRVTLAGQTIMIEANLGKNIVQTPKQLSQEEITSKIPEEWLIDNQEEDVEVYNTEIREIITEGLIARLIFNRSRSLRIATPRTIRSEPTKRSTSCIVDVDIRGLDNIIRPGITIPVYNNQPVEEEIQQPSPTS